MHASATIEVCSKVSNKKALMSNQERTVEFATVINIGKKFTIAKIGGVRGEKIFLPFGACREIRESSDGPVFGSGSKWMPLIGDKIVFRRMRNWRPIKIGDSHPASEWGSRIVWDAIASKKKDVPVSLPAVEPPKNLSPSPDTDIPSEDSSTVTASTHDETDDGLVERSAEELLAMASGARNRGKKRKPWERGLHTFYRQFA